MTSMHECHMFYTLQRPHDDGDTTCKKDSSKPDGFTYYMDDD